MNKTITIEIPEGKEAKWVDGVLTLVDERPLEFKFKVGDTVKKSDSDLVYKILEIHLFRGKRPVYKIDDGFGWKGESELTLYVKPKDITERIKTFKDAYYWCEENGHVDVVKDFLRIRNTFTTQDCNGIYSWEDIAPDLIAYLKLRIITCALNEGWEPTFEDGEKQWFTYYKYHRELKVVGVYETDTLSYPQSLLFKTKKLAEYAATQFKDIYMDFCYKGKE